MSTLCPGYQARQRCDIDCINDYAAENFKTSVNLRCR
jgi:hypothetical protein